MKLFPVKRDPHANMMFKKAMEKLKWTPPGFSNLLQISNYFEQLLIREFLMNSVQYERFVLKTKDLLEKRQEKEKGLRKLLKYMAEKNTYD